MFAIITPALITGAIAERMKFSGTGLHAAVGPAASTPRSRTGLGQGRLAERDLGGGSALDFAGGTVVHISSGVSALVCALMIGKRTRVSEGADAAAQPACSRFIGAGLLWVGWFGFNAGSALAAGTVARPSAFVATHFAAAAATLGWLGDGVAGHARRPSGAGRGLRRGRRARGDHAGVGIRQADARAR